jgi:hypothetical protein
MKKETRDSIWGTTPVQTTKYKRDDGVIIVDIVEADGDSMISMGELFRANLAEAKAYYTLLGMAIQDAEQMEAKASAAKSTT